MWLPAPAGTEHGASAACLPPGKAGAPPGSLQSGLLSGLG